MGQVPISEFHASIERHLEESRKTWVETGSRTAPTPGTLAEIAFEGMSTDYLDALQDLCNKVSACLKVNGPNSMRELDSLALLSPALLWMIPAFCFSPQFLDPLDAEERCVAIQKTRLGREDNFTDDIWDKDLIHDWAGSDDSRLLLLQGNSHTTKRFERFAVEIIHALKSNQPIQPARLAYVLKTPRTHWASTQLVPSDLLQQVAIQCLQYVRPKTPTSFLVSIFDSFKIATTSRDWFAILQDICISIPSLYIIIDLTVLGRHHEEIRSWPAAIQDMFDSFKSSNPGCRLKIMLLSCHRLSPQAGETLVIKAPPISSASPNGQMTRKKLRRIVTDTEDTPLCYGDEIETAGVPQSTSSKAESPLPFDEIPSGQALSASLEGLSRTTHLDIESPCVSEPRERSDFRIAIICALTLESDAVQDVFDKPWDEGKYGKMPGDPNQYTTGVIGCHNVVVVHMPGMGKSNGASVAANCRASFSNLGLVLVVGICGGVPFTKSGAEIVLGDIVVSDGLIQYDFGRQFPDRFVRKNDTIARPNSEILSFLAKMKGRWGSKKLRERTAIHLEHLRDATELGAIADYPGAWRDTLYEPTYRHKHQEASTCEVCSSCDTKNDPVCEAALTLDCESLQCDDSHLIARQRLVVLADENKNQEAKTGPFIHFGLYASGDKVMKSGEEREIIAEKEGVVAFEMEGSGVWEGFPGRCLVVKAVCDYADSHKNKRWQTYAAASAAACTKALLESWSP
ncbi:Nucleoside phosphorylase domain protein [Diaporthe eres]|nr:Nucleoside phosphorylase domain protein [Diaporthe eres]